MEYVIFEVFGTLSYRPANDDVPNPIALVDERGIFIREKLSLNDLKKVCRIHEKINSLIKFPSVVA